MKMEIVELLKENIGAHMSIVFESDSVKRMYEYVKYNFISEQEKKEVYIKELVEHEINRDICSIDLSAVVSVERRTLYDMEKITIHTSKERIGILLYQYGEIE